jgi:hypothetical protein
VVTAVNVSIKATDVNLVGRVEKLLDFYLTGLAGEVRQVRVSVDDVTDQLGVSLKRCQIDGDLVHGGKVVIVETQSDLNLAITRALDRCVRTIRRRQTRQRLSRSA